MIVVDASVVVEALTDDGPHGDQVWAELIADPDWATVPHVHAEVLSAVRGLFRARKLPRARAERSLAELSTMVFLIIETTLLLPRMWELRDNLTGYDAAYVAAAEALGCPLVTADAHLAAAPGLRCEVQLVA